MRFHFPYPFATATRLGSDSPLAESASGLCEQVAAQGDGVLESTKWA